MNPNSRPMASSLGCGEAVDYNALVYAKVTDGEAVHTIFRGSLREWQVAGFTLAEPLAIAEVPDCLWNYNDPGDLNTPPVEEPVAPTTGAINTLSNGSLQGGSGYVDAVYEGVALTGGTGNSATADINVSGGAVTVVSLENGGADYTAGDVLSADAANLGGTGSGFSINVGSILTTRGQVIYAAPFRY